MIRVNLSCVLPPRELTEANSAGQRERQRVVNFYSNPANHEEIFKYRAYKLAPVKEVLENLFHHKCAYCESKYAATQPVDVEHYRPKGEVICSNGACQKPGYYWLAADWGNLLPSCIDCNRERTQELADGTTGLTGKAAKFPIADETRRARFPGDERYEQRLLLHPYLDFPEKHLEFTEDGNIRPRRDKRGKISKKGVASIEVYGLRRRGLVSERRSRAILIKAHLRHVEEALEDLDRYPDDLRFVIRLRRELVELKKFLDAHQPYVGMARQLIHTFFQNKGVDVSFLSD